MKIYIASDHAGYELKSFLKNNFAQNGKTLTDLGAHDFVIDDDYPDIISKLAREISNDPSAKGIVIGYSGQGESIVANRFPNVRCALYYGGNKDILRLSREHNDANVIALGAHFIDKDEAFEAVSYWLKTEFSHEARHIRRINKIEEHPNNIA